jgi:4-hydroxy-3-polyprenylbenzoate decarboxylase
VGGKLGIDCTGEEITESGITLLSDEELLREMQKISSSVKDLKQYYTDTKNPICLISVEKNRSQKELFAELKPLLEHIKILIIVDEKDNYLDNPYMLIWRVVNNIDATRDIFFDANSVCVDATTKSELDGFMREWPDDVTCTQSVLESLKERKIIDIDDAFERKFLL